MIKAILLLSLVLLANGSIQWLTGVDYTQTFSADKTKQTTLQKDSTTPRTLTGQVTYQEGFEFEQIPKVFISLEKLQHVKNSNYIDYKITLGEVTKKGFSYTMWINFTSSVKTIDVRWCAVNDTHLDVQFYDFSTPQLDGTSKSQKSIFPIKFNKVYKEAPAVAIYILGASFIKSFADVQASVTDITTEGANIVISNKQSNVPGVSVEIVVVPKNRGQVVRVGGFFSKDKIESDDMTSYKYVPYDFPLDQKYLVGSTVFSFKGFSGFTLSNEKEFTLTVYDQETDNGQYSIKLGYWTTSTLIAFAYADILFFEPRDDCSFIYDQCDFKGNLVEICKDESLNSFVSTPFETQDIKSVYVPAGTTLQLYNEENLGGLRATFTESATCIDKIVADE